MVKTEWAESVARDLLEQPLPRRWAHTRGVAATARTLSAILTGQADLVVAAAWLHDVGYSPAIAATGFHPLDGARHLRDACQADDILCRLVAHHSCAAIGAAELGLDDELCREFALPPADLADCLTYCDMTTGPDGQRLALDDRIGEILSRYGPDHVVARSIVKSAPQLTASIARVTGNVRAAQPDIASRDGGAPSRSA